MEELKGAAALDAGLAASLQIVEHDEIARYGALKIWARELGLHDAAKLLDETLQEEIKTDQLLAKLATTILHEKAAGRRSGKRFAGCGRHTIQRQPPFSKAIARPWVIGASAAFAGGTPAMSVMRARATPPCETTNASPVSRSSQGRTRSASIA